MKLRIIAATTLILNTLTACTTIETHSGHTGNGIPYYLPKPVLLVKEPIEKDRSSELYAVVSLGGVTTALYKFSNDINAGIADLKKLKNINDGAPVVLKAIPSTAVNEVKSITKIDQKKIDDKKDDSVLNENTKEFAAKSGSTDESIYRYIPTDPSKSFEVFYVPDTSKPFNLQLNPGIFGGKVSATVSDGWKLTAVNGDQDISTALNSLTTLAGTMLTQRTDLKKSELTADKELELAKLTNESSDSQKSGDAQSVGADSNTYTKIDFRIIGYIRKNTITTIDPGLYDLNAFISGTALPSTNIEVWQRTTF